MFEILGKQKKLDIQKDKQDHLLKKQALCIASVASNLDNFNRSNVEILLGLGYEVTLAANFHTKEDINSQEKINEFVKEMRAKGVHIVHIDFSRKIGKIGQQVKSIMQVRKLLTQKFYLIHCHSPICAAIVRAEARKYRKIYGTKVFYTAHGFHFFKGASLKNWIIFYPIEKLMSQYTDVLITINHEDYKRAKKKFYAKKTIYIPGVGVDISKFHDQVVDREDKRKELGLGDSDIMLLSVGELSVRKNHEIVFRALAKLDRCDVKYFIAGTGSLKKYYETLIRKLGIQDQVALIGYRTDISELCKAADLYVFPSFQEGLPMALMEAIACRTPVICSRIRGNEDLIKDESCLFDPEDSDSLADCIRTKLNWGNGDRIREAMKELIQNNWHILKKYDLQNIKNIMIVQYENA